MSGELDPRIKIRAPLRCDGIGRLDCAEDLESGMRLAVRWLPLEANGDAAARACEKLPDHPTLPRIRQTGQVGGSAFVAMDFPDGALLSTQVGERMDTDLVLRIAAQLSDALATVHEQQVVHGEMSCDSVLLVPPDRAYLWDMPLVIANRLTDRRGENRLMQNLVKTAPYLAPERAQGAGASPEADVYSLGAVLCIAAGAPLPVAAATLGVVHLVASGAWFPRVPSTIPDPWRGMLAKMVSTDPSSRPTAREVARAFAQVPMPASLPTVPELPMVRLPPELMAAADALMRRRPDELIEVRPAAAGAIATPWSESRRTLEMPAVQAQTLARESLEMPALKVEPVAAKVDAPVEVKAEAKIEPAVEAKVEPAVEPVVAKVEPTPAPIVEAKTTTTGPIATVRLTENVSVTRELANAGAVAITDGISAEEIAATKSKLPWIIAMAMAAAIVVLTVVAVNLATRPAIVVQPVPATRPAPAPAARKAPTAPVQALAPKSQVTLPAAAMAAEEELAPVPVKRAPAPAPRARVARPAPVQPAAAPVAAPEPVAAPTEPARPQDFSFLEGAEAPKAELKRPEL